MPTNEEIDRELFKIGKKYSFFAINPINEEKEKKKFFEALKKRKKYNPQFKYEPYREDIDKIQQQLKQINPDNSVLGKLFKEKRRLFYIDFEMLKNRGNEKFTKYASISYGMPDKTLIKKAKELMKLKPLREKKSLSTKIVIRRLKYAFIKYGFNWDVQEKEMAASAAVKTEKKVLLIKKNNKFSKRFLKRIIVHEIGTHAIRAENGAHQPYKIFAEGLPGYLMTEEGLAVVNEEINGCLDNIIIKRYAGRVLAVEKGMKSSFYDTFKYLRRYFTKEDAWKLTIRVKRGINDTSKPGGCPKDIAYLQGYIEIKKFLEKGGDMSKLYYGKVGLQHVSMIEKIPHLIDPAYLPTIRYLKYFVDHFSGLVKSLIILNLLPLTLLRKPFEVIFVNGTHILIKTVKDLKFKK